MNCNKTMQKMDRFSLREVPVTDDFTATGSFDGVAAIMRVYFRGRLVLCSYEANGLKSRLLKDANTLSDYVVVKIDGYYRRVKVEASI